ncbi:hypothetical protein ACFY4C_27475 [Actinomadura viridis]|uniref:hypothetical protein n=1 Tax=Actinomadura viridis TaxID=58110 RepID=UPI0036C98157
MHATTPQPDHLATLGTQLSIRGYEVKPTEHGLRVTNPKMAVCCQGTPQATVTITCRPRPEDGGRLWFYTETGEPVAEADRITDAGVNIRGRIAERHHQVEESAW